MGVLQGHRRNMLMNHSSWNLTFFWSLTFFLLECCSTTSAGLSNSLTAHPMAEEMLEPQPPAESTAKRHHFGIANSRRTDQTCRIFGGVFLCRTQSFDEAGLNWADICSTAQDLKRNEVFVSFTSRFGCTATPWLTKREPSKTAPRCLRSENESNPA